ncbi:MAG: DNA polymerase Y family protein [Verrucomicrobiota bacterium]
MIAALHVPQLPLQVALWEEPDLDGQPCAMLAPGSLREGGPRVPVLYANARAQREGVETGMALTRALARCRTLQLRERVPEAEARMRESLLRRATHLAADVELADEATVLLDVFPIPEARRDPAAWLEALPEFPLFWRRAIGPTPEAAWLAAVSGREVVEEVEALWDLPLGVLATLGARPEWRERWEAWGLRRVGEFARLAGAAVRDRLGVEASRMHAVLNGERRRLRLHRPVKRLLESFELEEPVTQLEPLFFVLHRLLETLVGRLQAMLRVARELVLTLHFIDGRAEESRLRVADPSAGLEGLMAILRAFLEGAEHAAPTQAVTLEVLPTEASQAQRDWMRRGLADGNRFTETLAHLQSLVGRERVGRPRPARSHRAEDFAVQPFHSGRGGGEVPAVLPLPLRRFRPPIGVTVFSEGRGGLSWPLALQGGPWAGSITARRGPFLLSGHWWGQEAWKRVEWDVSLESGALLKVAQVGGTRWWVEGAYG